jgi:ribosome-binding protein aMBF1 (putative translation factor)
MTRRPVARPSRAASKAPRKRAAEEPDVTVLFGRLLKEARKAGGITQADLGRQTGIPQSKFSDMEAGRTDIRITTLRRLARALGVTLHSLLPPN